MRPTTTYHCLQPSRTTKEHKEHKKVANEASDIQKSQQSDTHPNNKAVDEEKIETILSHLVTAKKKVLLGTKFPVHIHQFGIT